MKYSDVIKTFAATGLSPEQLAPLIGISNMTYRRWCKKDGSAELSVLHERGVRHAMAELQKRGMLDSEGKAKAAGDEPSLNQLMAKAQSRVTGDRKAGAEAFLFQLLRVLGRRPKALPLIQASTKKLDEFEAENPVLGPTMALLRRLTSPQENPVIRSLACGALVYFLMPVDLIPDFTFGVGYLDDYGLMALALGFCKKVSPGLA